MRLHAAATFFDKTVCADAYAPFDEFLGQFDLFDDSKRDGATVDRRILSVGPNVVLPARGTFTVDGETWIIGGQQSDKFRGSIIRRKYVVHRANGAALVQSAAQALTTGGLSSFGAKLWVKDLKDLAVSSQLEGFFNLYLPAADPMPKARDVITLAGRPHYVRNAYFSAAGFNVAEVDELEADAIVQVSHLTRAYNPVSDTTSSTTASRKMLRMRWQDNYALSSAGAPKMQAGDIRGVFAKSAGTVPVNSQVVLNDGTWDILSVEDQGDCWGAHLRKAGT